MSSLRFLSVCSSVTVKSHADINADEARTSEEKQMMADANYWLQHQELPELENPRTGATALHVSAAKGYHRVMM